MIDREERKNEESKKINKPVEKPGPVKWPTGCSTGSLSEIFGSDKGE
jgi:hypothetical protein